MSTAEQRPLRFLRSREVCEKIGRSRTSLDTLRKTDPSFPEPIPDGEGRAAVLYWYEHEIEAWMLRFAEARRA